MKKVLSLVLVVIMLSAVLVSCGGNDIIGTWEAEEEGLTIQLKFEEDGKGSMSTMGISMDMTWSVDGDKLTASASFMGETEDLFKDAEFKVDGDTLTITVEGEAQEFTRVED